MKKTLVAISALLLTACTVTPRTVTVETAPATSPIPTASVASPIPVGPQTSFFDGMYEVGVDIKPGRYKTTGASKDAFFPNCYWERLKNPSGEFDAIISNGNTTGPAYVTLKKGEFVSSEGCNNWTLVK